MGFNELIAIEVKGFIYEFKHIFVISSLYSLYDCN